MKTWSTILAVLFLTTCAADAQNRWYKGDIHCHTDHSDGGLNQLADFLPRDVTVQTHIDTALLRGLDYLVISDHRTFTPYYDVLHQSDELLLIPGSEWGGHPHGVIIGMNENILDPGFSGFQNTQSTTFWAHAQGALMTMSHPGDPGNGWWTAPGDDFDMTQYVDLIEVWNAGPFWFGASDNRDSITRWEQFLNEGRHIVAVGASDTHFQQLDFVAGLGRPTTVVWARDKTEAAIMEGMRAGHVYVTADPAFPQVVEFTCDADADGTFEHMIGDVVEHVNPRGARMRVEIRGAAGTTLKVFSNDGLFLETPIREDEFTYLFTVPRKKAWYRLEVGRQLDVTFNSLPSAYQTVLMQGAMLRCGNEGTYGDMNTSALRFFSDESQVVEDLLALTNPIFIEPDDNAPGPTPVPGNDGPKILLAGYLNTNVSGGTPTLVAWIDPGQGTFSSVQAELLRGLMPTGSFLRDDGFSGDVAAGDRLYGARIDPLPVGAVGSNHLYGVRLRESDGTLTNVTWPWLVVE